MTKQDLNEKDRNDIAFELDNDSLCEPLNDQFPEELQGEGMIKNETKASNAWKTDSTRAFSKRLASAKKQWEEQYAEKYALEISSTNECQDVLEEKSQTERKFQQCSEEVESGNTGHIRKDDDIKYLQEQMIEFKNILEEQQLLHHPQMGEIYAQFKPRADEILNFAKEEGQQNDISVRGVYGVLLAENLSDIIKNAGNAAYNRATEEFSALQKSAGAALAGGEIQQNNDYSSMSNREFEKLCEKAKKGELRIQ